MEKNYRKKLTLRYKDGRRGQIFIIKRNNWREKEKISAIQVGSNHICNDGFIVSNRLFFQRMNNNKMFRIMFLHELGHFGLKKINFHFFDENLATIYGFIKYKRLFERTKNLKIKDLLEFLKYNLSYTFKLK